MLPLLSPKRRSRWSAAHSSPYGMGRPPGAHSGDRRRGYPQDWEFRDAKIASRRLGERVEELGESDEDDGQGVLLDPMNPAARQRAFVGDTLHFDGYDLGQHRTTRDRRGVYDDAYDDYYYTDEDYRDPRARHRASGPTEDTLLQAALDRIAYARVNGQTNVNLTREEMEALERRGSQRPEPASTALISPPTTPAKKIKLGSRTSSTSSLTGQKARKRSNSGFFSSPAKSNSKAKVTRKPSVDKGSPQPLPGAPGIMVPGPNGVPVFAPIGYYPPPSPELQRPRSGDSRSSSMQSRREATPPEQLYPPPRHYRPDSRGSHRSQEDADWYPPTTSRHRSASNAHYDYDMAPPGPAAPQGRRHASGPPDVRYASLRRAPQSSSPLAPRASPAAATASGLRRTETSSSSSSGEDQGVQVEIYPDENGGYSIRSAPAAPVPTPVPQAATPPGGKEARKRRSGRR